MDSRRREFVKLASSGFAGAAFTASVVDPVQGRAQSISAPVTTTNGYGRQSVRSQG